MPDVVEPGTRLVQRYRLEEHLGGPGVDDGGSSSVTTTGGGLVEGATYWRAHDELLDRPVSVCLLQAGTSYADRVLGAARRAAVLTDARFLRVLDAAEVDGLVYVVSEWVAASTLVDLLRDGPLPPAEARALAGEIAAALSAAHEAGLNHLALQPENVLRTAHGQVKLAGLAVDAAARGLRGTDPHDAARRDTQGAAEVLYAALTARWPGDEPTGLAPAPRDGDGLCSPRQVRAGVPDDLDDIVCRALRVPGRHGGPPLETVADLGRALATAQTTSRLPLPGPGRPRSEDDVPEEREARGPRLTAVAWTVVVLVLLAGIGLAGWQLASTPFGPGASDTSASDPGPADEPPGGTARKLDVRAATGFDPQGSADANGAENDDRARLAVDGDPATAWTTKTYNDPFGPIGLKDGVGLLLDLGSPKEITEVAVRTPGGTTDLELRVADEAGSDLEDFEPVGEARNVDRRALLRPDEVTARYLLVWLTALPPYEGRFRGDISEVVVTGR